MKKVDGLEDVTDDLQDQLDDLKSDVDANADDITAIEGDILVLEAILGTDCGSEKAIRIIASNGAVTCITINEGESVQQMTAFGVFLPVPAFTTLPLLPATCSLGFVATGGGMDSLVPLVNIADLHQSIPVGTTGWFATAHVEGLIPDLGVRSVAVCIRVL